MSFGRKTLGQQDKNIKEVETFPRQSVRRRQYKPAKIIFNNDNCVVDCILRDISETGARVKVDGAFDCPPDIAMQLPDGTRRMCEVIWFRNLEMGVKFVGEGTVRLSNRVEKARSLLDMAERNAPDEIERFLKIYRHLHDAELEQAMGDVREAHEKLIGALRRAIADERSAAA